MDDFMSTPVARAGPTSRLLKRQSGLPEPKSNKELSLERSLNLLDHALQSPIQSSGRNRMDISTDITRALDFTRAHPRDQDTRRVQDVSLLHDVTRPFDRSIINDVTRPANFGHEMLSMTLNSALHEENPGVKGTENLFDEFLAVSSTAANQGLDTIAEFEQMVGDHIHALRRVIVNLPSSKDKLPKTYSVLQDLVNERNTWRIMGKLYTDRLVTCAQAPPDLPAPAPGSEKQIIERFFVNNKEVRQAYMVVDWLEKNAQDEHEQIITQQMEWFSDATISWENTTAALSRGQGGPHMVKELDPDAPNRTGLQLHDLDQQDETRLVFCLYGLVRIGLLDEAQELCIRLGQPWRAATLEGWKLFHDPNYQSGTGGNGDKLPTEGNKYRDVWKKVAWGLTNDSSLPQYERAIYAALCGNLQQLRSVSTSWEDRLWAGAKCAVDVMVETEIRSNMVRNFAELPTEYWNTQSAMSKVLKEAGSATKRDGQVYHEIQARLILDDYPSLVRDMVDLVDQPNIEPHLLRLLAHIVIINKNLGIEGDREGEEKVLVAYAKFLMSEDKLGLIPWYISRLRTDLQLPLYSNYLAGVQKVEDQELCLYLGREVGLDIKSIIVAAVATVRATQSPDNETMVGSLGWLGLDPSQAADLLYQANAVIRRLLTVGQLELAGRAASKIPKDTLGRVVRAWREEGGGEELPGGAVREFLALKIYLEAQDAFSDWFDHFHRGQPKRPLLPDNPSFTEKVAHEQREKQYVAELDRWRGGQVIQSRQAEDKLREVINFPMGWLMEEQGDEDETEMLDEEEEKRRDEMNKLRAEILPQTFLLLHSVLHNTGQFQASILLGNDVVGEHTGNYAAFSKEKIKQFLAKIRESSMAVMEKGQDPWGFNKP